MIEFVNRVFTGAVSIAVIVAVLGALWRVPRRRDLIVLALGLVGGVFLQAVLGGMTVIFELRPELVMAHFLLSILLLANAIVLHQRAGEPEGEPRSIVSLGCSPRRYRDPGARVRRARHRDRGHRQRAPRRRRGRPALRRSRSRKSLESTG